MMLLRGSMAFLSGPLRAPFVIGICIVLNYEGKHKRKMVFWGVKLTGKQPATIKNPH